MEVAQRVDWLKATDEQGLQVVGDKAIAHCQSVFKVFTTINNRHILQEILDFL